FFFFFFFFFQAEDGIRDRNVTGVQTCALPIYPLVGTTVSNGIVSIRISARFDSMERAKKELEATEAQCRERLCDVIFGQDDQTRSEERRVGKECRARRVRKDEKRKE